MIFAIILLVISLNLDSLGAGLVYGMQQKYFPHTLRFLICALSILYSGISLVLGQIMSRHLNCTFGKYLGIVILLLMGIYSLLRAIFSSDSPTYCSNKSTTVGLGEALLIGLALSLDAMGASISFSLIGCGIMLLPFAIGLCQLLFLDIGIACGQKISASITDTHLTTVISILPGAILIILALLRL